MLPESAKPHLLQGIYAWCSEQGYTPYIVALVNFPGVLVPAGYDREGRIVLDISPGATHALQMGEGWIRFQARFGGAPRQIEIPMSAILAIYAAETQEGMGFPEPTQPPERPTPGPSGIESAGEKGGARPNLRVIK